MPFLYKPSNTITKLIHIYAFNPNTQYLRLQPRVVKKRVIYRANTGISLNFSKMIGNLPQVLNINRLFSNSTGSSVTSNRFIRFIGLLVLVSI
jgi:hypothetical protein